MSKDTYTIYEPLVYSATDPNRYKALMSTDTAGTYIVERRGDGITMSIITDSYRTLPISTEKVISGPVRVIGLN